MSTVDGLIKQLMDSQEDAADRYEALVSEMLALLKKRGEALDGAFLLLARVATWLDETHAAHGDEGAIGMRDDIIAYFRARVADRSAGAADSGIARIAAERQRQIDAEGWTPEHDDDHEAAELVAAAICYAEAGSGFDLGISPRDGEMPTLWPWRPEYWKPSDDLVRNLEKAGALIAAEIDRLLRQGGQS